MFSDATTSAITIVAFIFAGLTLAIPIFGIILNRIRSRSSAPMPKDPEMQARGGSLTSNNSSCKAGCDSEDISPVYSTFKEARAENEKNMASVAVTQVDTRMSEDWPLRRPTSVDLFSGSARDI